MPHEDLLDWAEDHGYVHCRCSRCHETWWTDSNDGCPNGCFDDEEEEEAEDDAA